MITEVLRVRALNLRQEQSFRDHGVRRPRV